MKKLLKISFLAGILMFIFAIKSNAADVTYGELQSNGSMEVTVTLKNDPTENEEFCTKINDDGWKLSGKTMTKTVEDAKTKPYFKFYKFTIGDDIEKISVATPFTMNVNDKHTLDSGLVISSSDESVVKQTGEKEITALSKGTATLSIRPASYHTDESYSWDITVTDSSETTDPTPPSTPTGDYTAAYDNKNIVVKGLPKLSTDKSYRCIVDMSSSAEFENSANTLKDNEDGTFSIGTFQDLIELNKDVYIHIFKPSDTLGKYEKVTDIKVTKPTFNEYNYFYDASHSTYSHTQLLLSLPYSLKDATSEKINRKIHYKIGRITDNSILMGIKNGDSSSFGKLKDFAKNDNSPLYNEVVTANLSNGYETNEEIIAGNKLVDEAYYYLYAELETEDGKFIPLESITLAQADVFPSQDYAWYLFFYGSNDFNFDGVSDAENPLADDSGKEEKKNESDSNLAKAGESHIILALLVVGTVSAIVIYRKNKSTKIK